MDAWGIYVTFLNNIDTRWLYQLNLSLFVLWSDVFNQTEREGPKSLPAPSSRASLLRLIDIF